MKKSQKTLFDEFKSKIKLDNRSQLRRETENKLRPTRDLLKEVDLFVSAMRYFIKDYRSFRANLTSAGGHSNIAIKMGLLKKGMVSSETSLREVLRRVPKVESEQNLISARLLYNKGYKKEAIEMCNKLGVDFYDFFPSVAQQRRKEVAKLPSLPKKDTLPYIKVDKKYTTLYIWTNKKTLKNSLRYDAPLKDSLYVSMTRIRAYVTKNVEHRKKADLYDPKIGEYISYNGFKYIIERVNSRSKKFLFEKEKEIEQRRIKREKEEERTRAKKLRDAERERKRIREEKEKQKLKEKKKRIRARRPKKVPEKKSVLNKVERILKANNLWRG